ncbi:MAG: hypothetical protein MJZ79_02125 [Paludibacteraceae bacterium]|nr:hypothetical protein [Paludibacteraceae bacterium]
MKTMRLNLSLLIIASLVLFSKTASAQRWFADTTISQITYAYVDDSIVFRYSNQNPANFYVKCLKGSFSYYHALFFHGVSSYIFVFDNTGKELKRKIFWLGVSKDNNGYIGNTRRDAGAYFAAQSDFSTYMLNHLHKENGCIRFTANRSHGLPMIDVLIPSHNDTMLIAMPDSIRAFVY